MIKPSWSLTDPIWFVRISVSMTQYHHIEESTIYYRCGMSYNYLCRWLWYFEYLQARIKVAHPHRVVSIIAGRLDSTIILGQDFIEKRRASLLKSRHKKLDELVRMPYNDDLFGFTSQEVQGRINQLREDITALERGTYTIPSLPDYVNNVKAWI